MIEIRKATPADAENILAYCRIIGGESDNLTFGSEGILSMTVEKEMSYLESILHSENQIYLLALEDGEIVGSCQYNGFTKARLAHRGEIAISVKKAMWGRHIGTRMMEALLDFARNIAQAEILSLEVRSDNARAIALYQKFGFEKIGTFPGFLKINGTDVDCDIMRLHL